MIQLIVNAFVEKEKTGAVVEVLYASSDHEKVKAKYEELTAQDLVMRFQRKLLTSAPLKWNINRKEKNNDRTLLSP